PKDYRISACKRSGVDGDKGIEQHRAVKLLLGSIGRSDRSAQRHPWLLRSIRPTRATATVESTMHPPLAPMVAVPFVQRLGGDLIDAEPARMAPSTASTDSTSVIGSRPGRLMG